MSLPNFESFKARFKGDLVTPIDSDYEQAIARWAANAQRQAALVLYPKDEQDVSEAVKWVSSNKIPLAVCGGGHSSTGASSVEGGVVIALSRYFDEARVDPERKLAYVGGGAVWAAVDKAGMAHGLATTGGTVNHTGVGGLTLGGGFGYLSSEHGLTIDNLTEATVVTADGSILKANDAENSDLFWAIRGGGGNFGVVTEFVIRVHPQRATVFSGFVAFPEAVVGPLFAAADDWFLHNKSIKATALVTVTNPPPAKQPMVVAVVFYNGSEEEGRQHFKWLFDFGPIMDQCREMPYDAVNGVVASFTPHGRGVCMTGAAQTSPDIPSRLYEAFKRHAKENPEFTIIFGCEYFGLETLRKVPQDATAFALRNAPSNIMLQCQFDGKAPNLKELEIRAKEVLVDMKKVACNDGQAPVVYGNYDGVAATHDAAKALFKENYPRLQALKAKYDPDLVFSKWFPIQPKA